MAKPLTNREMELFKLALNWRCRYDNSNPDVGMEPGALALAKEIANGLSFKIDEDDIAEICEEVSGS